MRILDSGFSSQIYRLMRSQIKNENYASGVWTLFGIYGFMIFFYFSFSAFYLLPNTPIYIIISYLKFMSNTYI